jgi:hypothetical protein
MFSQLRQWRELRQENERLRSALQAAEDAVAEHRRQEHDLLEVLVRARTDARELLERARTEARTTVDGATEESERLKAASRAELATLSRELERLRDTQRTLEASLQQSLALLAPVLPLTSRRETGHKEPADSGGPPRHVQSKPDGRTLLDAGLASFDVEALAPDQRAANGAPGGSLEISPRGVGAPGHAVRMLGGIVVVALGIVSALAWTSWQARATAPAGPHRAAPAVAPPSAAAAGKRQPDAGAPRPADTPAEPAAMVAAATSATLEAAGARNAPDLRVSIHTISPVWMRAEVDGNHALARVLRDGEHVDLRAEREVVIRAGDAGAVVVAVDGKPGAALGRSGAVVTRRITRSAAARARVGPDVAQRLARPMPPAGQTARALPAVTAAAPSIPLATVAQPSAPAASQPVPKLSLLPAPAPALAGPPAPAPLPAGLTPEENEVLRAHQSYFDALRGSDQAGIRRVIAPSFTASGVPPPIGEAGLSVSNVAVQISGVGAVVSGSAHREAHEGAGASGRLLFSEVWTNTKGTWQLLSVRFVEVRSGQ